MKIKNIAKLLILLFGLNLLSVNAEDIGLSIKDISKDSDTSLKVTFDKAIGDSGISGDIKLFKDLSIVSATKDSLVPNKINISLNDDLTIGSTYNLFPVFGAEGSADFIFEEPANIKILESEGISSITMKDKKNIEVYFNTLNGDEFEFKLLKEINIVENSSSGGNLILKTDKSIELNTDYILMILSLSDIQNIYKIDEPIFNFDIKENSTFEKTETDQSIKDNFTAPVTETINPVENDTELNAGIEDTSTGNLNNVALDTKQTPDTGAETWVLMFLTLIMSSFYFLARRFS
ncbi:MAG: hypothetical protein PHN31_05965 [Candidatus Gracilibacteria bacterium]|nr:hypothetical protein [Candidatus Gracilibacteria bacterium]